MEGGRRSERTYGCQDQDKLMRQGNQGLQMTKTFSIQVSEHQRDRSELNQMSRKQEVQIYIRTQANYESMKASNFKKETRPHDLGHDHDHCFCCRY